MNVSRAELEAAYLSGYSTAINLAPATGDEDLLTTREPCLVHKNHSPFSHINECHHIWPKGHGGPNTKDNLVVVCATGHNNIHDLIKAFQVHRGNIPYNTLRRYTFGERDLAKLGYDRITRGAM